MYAFEWKNGEWQEVVLTGIPRKNAYQLLVSAWCEVWGYDWLGW